MIFGQHQYFNCNGIVYNKQFVILWYYFSIMLTRTWMNLHHWLHGGTWGAVVNTYDLLILIGLFLEVSAYSRSIDETLRHIIPINRDHNH